MRVPFRIHGGPSILLIYKEKRSEPTWARPARPLAFILGGQNCRGRVGAGPRCAANSLFGALILVAESLGMVLGYGFYQWKRGPDV